MNTQRIHTIPLLAVPYTRVPRPTGVGKTLISIMLDPPDEYSQAVGIMEVCDQ